MPASPYRSSTTFSAGGSPGTVSVTKPAGTVDGDLIIVSFTCYDGASAGSPCIITGFTSGPRLTYNSFFTGWVYKIADGEPASWTLNTSPGSPETKAVVGQATAINRDFLGGTIDNSSFSATLNWGTTDASAPMAAGYGGHDNDVADKYGIFITGEGSTAGTHNVQRRTDGAAPDATQPTVLGTPITRDISSEGSVDYLHHVVYEEFSSADWPGSATTPAEGAAIWIDTVPTAAPVTFVGGLWVPGYVASPTTASSLDLHVERIYPKARPYELGRNLIRE